MKLELLQRKLIATARANPPSDRVPLAFEKRIMSLILARPIADHWASWARALWLAAAPSVAILLALGTWAYFNPSDKPSPDLSQQFDKTLLAAVDQDGDATW